MKKLFFFLILCNLFVVRAYSKEVLKCTPEYSWVSVSEIKNESFQYEEYDKYSDSMFSKKHSSYYLYIHDGKLVYSSDLTSLLDISLSSDKLSSFISYSLEEDPDTPNVDPESPHVMYYHRLVIYNPQTMPYPHVYELLFSAGLSGLQLQELPDLDDERIQTPLSIGAGLNLQNKNDFNFDAIYSTSCKERSIQAKPFNNAMIMLEKALQIEK